MHRAALLGVVVLLVTAGCAAGPLGADTNQTPESQTVTVVDVVDGDTIDVLV